MKKIYKYGLGIDGTVIGVNDSIEKFLHIECQDGWPMVWVLINDELEKESYDIYCIGTGWEFNPKEDDEYLGTTIDQCGFVWHYFARRNGKIPL